MVSTDPYLFHGTLGENVRYGAADADDSRVADAIARADLAELIRSLPQGLSTVVGERGVTLSAGQRQRVALARAFLRAPEILVLDEATSSLDLLSEDRVRLAIRELMDGKTTLIITHRVHAVRDADRIAVLANGRVGNLGTHAELTEQRGTYRSFLRICADGSDGAGEGRRA
jgi:ABC-type multidrug transport system fused ATPase/permease subunit